MLTEDLMVELYAVKSSRRISRLLVKATSIVVIVDEEEGAIEDEEEATSIEAAAIEAVTEVEAEV